MSDPTISSLRVFDNNNWNISIDGIPGIGPTLRQLVNELKGLIDQAAAFAAGLGDRVATVNSAFAGLGALPDALSGGAHAAPVPPPLSSTPIDGLVGSLVDAIQVLNGKLHSLVSWIETPVRGMDNLLALLQTSYQNVSTFIHTLVN
ncbi:Uncharacterised protein [Bordetella ansorpii]|uniref:Uncharacterized protein n=1 Tax=Bordetella ansorpii TaxID=288768 RepID=A0A157SNU2_9BORD|nr:hypothetical protein [Bordetella ansorpii]SAI72117.1 Uncharacterised protein [Bordetella ansorpii]